MICGTASESEDFEHASKIRDDIRSLETTALRQRITFSGGTRDKDVVTVARQGEVAAAIVFQVREGNVVGTEKFILEGVSSSTSDEEIISSFLQQHYASEETLARGSFPQEIVLPTRIKDSSVIESLINDQRARKASGEFSFFLLPASEDNSWFE